MRWRARPLRLLLSVVGISVVVFFAPTCARHIQASLSLGSATAVSSQQLKAIVYGPMGHYASIFGGVFYAGSNDSFDYVALKHGSLAIYAYRMPRGDVALQRRMQVTSDEKKWVDLARAFPPLSDGRPASIRGRR